jgi:hypothetical protein
MMGRTVACVVLGLCAAPACGGSAGAGAGAGGAGAVNDAGDAAIDAQGVPHPKPCAASTADEALGPPQLVASGRNDMTMIATTKR